jgi:hypothetical protein
MKDTPPVGRTEATVTREHPLLSKKIGVAFALLAFSGVGIALMSINAPFFGSMVSLLGPAGIIWVYWRDFVPLKPIDAAECASAVERSIALIFMLVALVAPGVTYVTVARERATKDLEQSQIEIARRWIRLSEEILTDIPSVKNSFKIPTYDPSIPQEIRNRLWQEETQRSLDTFQQGLAMLTQKYSSRIAEAELEMKKMNIKLVENGMTLDRPLVNTFSWEAWSAKLGGEGRRILTQYGQEP